MKNYYEAFIPEPGDKKISRPGQYQGYVKRHYDGYVYFSEYVPMRDGTKLAVTYYRPTLRGILVEDPLPVIWRFTPYGRILYHGDGTVHHTAFFTGDGAGMGPAPKVPDDYAAGLGADGPQSGAEVMLEVFTSFGYVVAQADVRGKFASFGIRRSLNPKAEPMDAYEINEWLASRPWCDGNVGMFGSSYTGQTQLEAIRMNPPHLKAAMVCMTDFNKYDGWITGGIARGGDINMKQPDDPEKIVPVDEDTDGELLKMALYQHTFNEQDIPLDEGEPKRLPHFKYGRLPYRDSVSKATDSRFWIETSASTYREEINRSGVAVYLIGGWFDVFRRETFMLYENLDLPKKLIMGPWFHTRFKKELNLLVEHMRFFDYWLKGIENGVMDEPPIYMKTVRNHGEDPEGIGWGFEERWPVADTRPQVWFLKEGRSGTAKSVNDGFLQREAPDHEGGKDLYLADYSIRDWEEQDFAEDLNEKALTYTSEILDEDCTVVGHPIVDLYFTETGKDTDFYVVMMDVEEDGKARLVSNGRLRASLRLTEKAPYRTMGLPWHPCREQDVMLPEFSHGPLELTIDLLPVSYVFQKGHRIRLAVASSMGRYQYYREDPAPEISLYRSMMYPSRITLPVREEKEGGDK